MFTSLKGKKIVLGVCGSIAAYKAVVLCRLLIQNEAEVRIIMTSSAKDFVSPLTFSTLSKHEVFSDISGAEQWNNHIELGLWADVLLISPATATSLAKMATGFADNMLTAVYLSAKCPVYFAPAMDLDMWKHPATQKNIDTLLSYGHKMIPVGFGELASGLIGEGRMAEPEIIVDFLAQNFQANQFFAGKKVLVTAGPTYEYIDPVRYIGNASSGKMGWAIAEAFESSGAEVTLVLGPATFQGNRNNINVVEITSSEEMLAATDTHFVDSDIVVFAAAVADYKVAKPATQKIKKKTNKLSLDLVKTTDIAATLSKKKKAGQITVGFALETNDGLTHAKEKLTKKGFDVIVLNSLEDKGAGFQHDTNKVTIVNKNGQVVAHPLKTKKEVALDIVQHIRNMMLLS